jgi:hypothetical protein
MRSFMAASTMTKVLAPFCLTKRTRVRSAPAWATRKRPGSSRRCGWSAAGHCAEGLVEGGGVVGDLAGGEVEGGCVGWVGVVDAEAAAGVDVADVVAVAFEVGDEADDAGERGGEGFDLADLGADVDADAGGVEPGRAGGLAVEGAGEGDIDAELVLAQAGGDVGVGVGEDVGIDAEGEAGAAAEGLGAGSEEVEFGGGFDVEEEDVGAEGGVDLPGLFADAGEDDAPEGRACWARRTRSSSPPETMSKPAPSWPRRRRMARAELALTA